MIIGTFLQLQPDTECRLGDILVSSGVGMVRIVLFAVVLADPAVGQSGRGGLR